MKLIDLKEGKTVKLLRRKLKPKDIKAGLSVWKYTGETCAPQGDSIRKVLELITTPHYVNQQWVKYEVIQGKKPAYGSKISECTVATLCSWADGIVEEE